MNKPIQSVAVSSAVKAVDVFEADFPASTPEAGTDTANAGVTYAIEISRDLGQSAPWSTVTPDVNDDITISNLLPAGSNSRFARLRVIQVP